MFSLGPSDQNDTAINRPLRERIFCVGAAAMAYWFYRWDWGESVVFDALDAATDATGMRMFSDFVDSTAESWVKTPRSEPPTRMGPARSVLVRAEKHGREDYLAFAREIGDDLLARKKVPDGPVILDVGRDLVFVDNHYGDPTFLVELSRATGDPRYAVRGIEILLGHTRALQDEKAGLYSHFSDVSSGKPEPNRIFWGRGQGWVAMGVSEVLSLVGASGFDDRRMLDEIRERYLAFCEALAKHEVAGGGWRNVIDEPASYPEMSSTAMVAAGLTRAVREGIVPESYSDLADRAWNVIANRIDVNGHLVGVSYRPGMNVEPSRYEHAPTALGAFPWAQGPYMLAAVQRYE